MGGLFYGLYPGLSTSFATAHRTFRERKNGFPATWETWMHGLFMGEKEKIYTLENIHKKSVAPCQG